jgi:hypothetical protein
MSGWVRFLIRGQVPHLHAVYLIYMDLFLELGSTEPSSS